MIAENTIRVRNNLLLRWSGVFTLLVLWESAPRLGWVDREFAPPLSTVVATAARLVVAGELTSDIIASLWRGLLGLFFAVAIGVPAAFIAGHVFSRAGRRLEPLLRVLAQVNPFTLLPVFLLFFGIGEAAKIAVIGWVSLWPIFFYTWTGVRTVDPLLVKTARSMAAGASDLYLKVLLPGALPTIFTGVRIASGLVFFMLVAAEMFGANAGLGALVHRSAMNYQIPEMYAGSACIVLLGYLLSRGLHLAEQGLFWYREDAGAVITGESAARRWRVGKRSVYLLAGAVAAFLILGGWRVREINYESTQSIYGHHHHHHHRAAPAGGADQSQAAPGQPGSATQAAATQAVVTASRGTKLTITVLDTPITLAPEGARFRIELRDAAGAPVTDGKVTLAASMPGMDMGIPDFAASATSAAGIYAGSSNLGMTGPWVVKLSVVRSNGETASAQFNLEVR